MTARLTPLAILLLGAASLCAGTNQRPQDHLRDGIAAYTKSDYQTAAQEFVAALKTDDSSAAAYYYLGLSYRNLRQYDRALFTLHRLLELGVPDPQLNAETYAAIARIHNLSGSPRKAVDIILYALKNGFKNPSLLNELASSYLTLRNYRNSKKALDISLTLEPDNAYTYNLLGLLYLEIRRYPSAETSFETAVAFKPEIAMFHANLGLSLERQNRFADALKSYRKAAGLGPAAPEYAAAVRRLQRYAGHR